MPELPARVAAFGEQIAGELVGRLGASLVAVFTHGSAVLGDFDPRISDVDLLIILRDDIDADGLDGAAEILRAPRECPGLGLEASAVRAASAFRPTTPWPFLVHVTTMPNDPRVVYGTERDGDEDLILHYAVTRAAGVALVGAPADALIGQQPREVILHQIARELRWAVREASGPYAVLNACRALRYRADGSLVAKTDAGRWAMTRDVPTDLVQPAVDARLGATTYPITGAATDWVLHVAEVLEREAAG